MSLTLNFDINLFYQAFSSTMVSLWPIIAPAFAIMLVGMLLGGLMTILRRMKD